MLSEETKKMLKKYDDKLYKKMNHIPCYPECINFVKYVRQGLCRFCQCKLYSHLVVCGNCGNIKLKDK